MDITTADSFFTGDQRESAKRVAEKWCYQYQVLWEGEETKDFWDKLGGYQEYKKLKSERKCSEIGIATEVAVPPRAFKCSFLDEDLSGSHVRMIPHSSSIISCHFIRCCQFQFPKS